MDRRGDEEAGNFALVEYGEATGLSIAPKRRAFKFARVPLSWKSNHDDNDDDDDDDDDSRCGSRANPFARKGIDRHRDKNASSFRR